MPTAKEQVKQMIAKRQKQNAAYKKQAAKRAGVEQIVLEFIRSMEKAAREAETAVEFDFALSKEASLLEDRMKMIDPYVSLAIMWNREDLAEEWKDLQVDGVKVIWSDYHLKKNPEIQKEKHISMISLFMGGEMD